MTEVWMSTCSVHREFDAACARCGSGHWMSESELQAVQRLYAEDFPQWYRANNGGREPGENAWLAWEQITGRSRPQ
jgi:hypothetical protein